ncbi:P-loop containing nucleoside triphosphate hydrolase protein [Daldinia loculata]|uniref:P-loop containing nucleoside triphosphate hydrolase protein n=1 Tax=Daldinia loculata TaxID=103429 RepID=UPI0020C5901C|nr:P-loop containing nucleoside triphosphate hydrolase protein [Daldinia loculata]KAI1643597.1 P-loop containing nucleoside triphosphate hydrolase protein [Daldinia loculata]KAI2779861.1 P-loop containing nucleoside triphosphate hydrolase protein [Daldinia loculata]
MFKAFATAIRRLLSRINLGSILSFHLVGWGSRRGVISHRFPSVVQEASTGLYKSRSSTQPLIIFILGAPGTGKGTLSKFLNTTFSSLTHLSYGDLIRYEDRIPGSWVSSFPRREGTERPNIPARSAVTLLRNTIEDGVVRNGQLAWLVDGFPRREQHVTEWVAQMPRARCILYLTCPPEVSLVRVLGRASTSGRPDDANEVRARERITRSIAESEAMLVALEESGMQITRVDANRDFEVVREEVLQEIRVSLRYRINAKPRTHF